jgi:ribosome maturation factor RimP
LSDAKLVLTEDLIREMLRQKKASGIVDEAQFDEIEETLAGEDPDPDGDEDAPAKPDTKH